MFQSGILTDRECVSLFLHFTVNPKPPVGFLDVPRYIPAYYSDNLILGKKRGHQIFTFNMVSYITPCNEWPERNLTLECHDHFSGAP